MNRTQGESGPITKIKPRINIYLATSGPIKSVQNRKQTLGMKLNYNQILNLR